MKNLINGFLWCALCFTLISASCKKEKTGIEGLPPATQTGKQTFGCMVNGVLFLPKGSLFTGEATKQSYYQLVKGVYYFAVAGTNSSNSSKLYDVTITSQDVLLKTGMTIPLTTGKIGEASGWYWVSSNKYETDSVNKGELKITRFDDANQIVSGTFWFDAVNDKGEKVEVREGRFDMRFVK